VLAQVTVTAQVQVQGVADCAELRAHDYEVNPEVIVVNGIALEPLFRVWRPFSTYYTPR
jgi:hypothetical protein